MKSYIPLSKNNTSMHHAASRFTLIWTCTGINEYSNFINLAFKSLPIKTFWVMAITITCLHDVYMLNMTEKS